MCRYISVEKKKRKREARDLFFFSPQYDPAPGEMREVTISTKYALSSALVFPQFLSPSVARVENTHLQSASNHMPCFSNLLTPSDLQLYVWWVAKELLLRSNFTLNTTAFIRPTRLHCTAIPKGGQQTACVRTGSSNWNAVLVNVWFKDRNMQNYTLSYIWHRNHK